MGKTVTIKLSGLAEVFMNQMKQEGLDEADVIAQGIGLLEEVWRTGRVALVKAYDGSRELAEASSLIEHYFHVRTPASMKRNTGDSPGPAGISPFVNPSPAF